MMAMAGMKKTRLSKDCPKGPLLPSSTIFFCQLRAIVTYEDAIGMIDSTSARKNSAAAQPLAETDFKIERDYGSQDFLDRHLQLIVSAHISRQNYANKIKITASKARENNKAKLSKKMNV